MWTESEAKTKICPHLRPLPPEPSWRGGGGGGGDASGLASRFITCQGTQCMAWRHFDQIWIVPPGQTDRAWVARGHCGLSGIPTHPVL